MHPPAGHRKTVKHDDAAGEAHELTFSCFRRLQLLRLESRRQLLADAIDRALQTQHYQLIAYVFMPEHVHLLVWPLADATGIAMLLFAIKRPVSYRIKQRLIEEDDSLLETLTIRDRPHHTSFRFWQEGPGYDRNIRKEETLHSAIDCINRNPVRRGLVRGPSDWKWSSWHAYEGKATDAPIRPTVTRWG